MSRDNDISEFAHLVGEINIGSGNFIAPGATIIGPITIGDDNYFGPNCVIGTPPQDNKFDFNSHVKATLGQPSHAFGIEIGNKNVVREFATIHKGLTSQTIIENSNYIMSYAHIAHDCEISSGVKVANNVQMGGYTSVLSGAYIGLSSVVHQFSVIGQFSMVGMGSVVNKDIPTAGLAIGSPSRTIKVNTVALQSLGISDNSWESGYIKNPSIDSIHPDLKLFFLKYLDEQKRREAQRIEVSIARNQLP